MNFDIIINDEIETYGLITYELRQEGEQLIRSGMLKTHLYIEEIDSIACDRFRLDGVNVYAETSGSNDIFFIYVFDYETIEILNNGTEYSLEELLEMYKKEVE